MAHGSTGVLRKTDQFSLLQAAELARRTVNVAAGHAPRRSALQLGCGAGCLLAVLKASGWRVHGIEADAAACQSGRSRYELSIFAGTLAQWLQSPLCRPFPLVLHLDMPPDQPELPAFVRGLHAATEPAGVLVLQSPNSALDRMLTESGFEVLMEYQCPPLETALPPSGTPERERGGLLNSMRTSLRALFAAHPVGLQGELERARAHFLAEPGYLDSDAGRAAQAAGQGGHRLVIACRQPTLVTC
jgi:2-polyprenyl-3-methyl-5-hydroxy-6-metoxy-1,4-benzoquinol methylase